MEQKSIAVLPFENISSDPENEYFSDGMTEELINALGKIGGLKVTARTSSFAFKHKKEDVRIIGNELGVSTVLEGSIRKAGNRVRITTQLIRTDNGFHIWSENFDRELNDIFALQDEISLLIADKIRENFGHMDIDEHLIEPPTQNIEAYTLFLKARYHHLKWNTEGITTAIQIYGDCISKEPKFSLPYFGLGYCYSMSGSWGEDKSELLEVAENYLNEGLLLDQQSYHGFFGLATLYFWGKWDFEKGLFYFKKALQLNPSYTEAEEGLAELYTAIGDFNKGLVHTQNILKINPLSPNHYFTKGNILFLSNNFQGALECMESALRIDQNFSHAIELKQLCYIKLKEYEKLNDFLLKNHHLAEHPNACRALYQLIHQDENIDFDLALIGPVFNEKKGVTLFPWPLFLHVYLGNIELALDLLEEAIRKKRGQYINFMNSPLLTPLHGHERFKSLIKETFKPDIQPKEKVQIPAVQKEANSLLSESETRQFSALLQEIMDNEKPYYNSTLSLRNLAELINIHPNKLSWLLNKQLGKSFNEYINSYRIESFKTMALSPENNHMTLLGLAYECGFNSKSVFNDSFKKSTGKTPKLWLKQNRK
ncbi:helix-turn-helix domain-containing protein [Flexithrix dorotheae]|uniref:helix-turn-helix domain-containing protein n=1 Tax=Flexithrix dorotheae TaxID=70993 RepID=UPI000373BFAD|nr:helix-turn-helix domain-containing protein [Flexithrix dorotheae]